MFYDGDSPLACAFVALSLMLWPSVVTADDSTPAAATASSAAQTPALPDHIKVAAVQINGYDKGDLPRQGFEPADSLIPYIHKAGKDNVDLIVFPEYVLGHIKVPAEQTQKISAAAAAARVYVIVGCWEEFDDGTFANTALIFDRQGHIAGKYRKTHAAVDHYEGDPPWSRPLSGKSKEWMLQNDPEWIMERGQDLPVFDFDFGRLGIMTCYDGWFPEPARVLSLRGAEVIVWINGRGGSVEDFIVRTTMFQSHVAMITANQAYGSGTMIGQWPAAIQSRCPDKTEAYITGTINLKQIRNARSRSRNFQQRRPDLYDQLTKSIR
jgi:predicted amidohydrolase